jgi:membrane protease YdiL (CAAX protease family)
VRDAPPFRLDRIVIALALLIAIAPVIVLVRQLRHQEWIFALYAVLAIGGAVAAAYAIRAMTRTTLRQLGLCLATAGVIGLIFVLGPEVSSAITERILPPVTHHQLDIGLGYFFLYLPAVFVVEEVFFRGAIDSYIHRPGERTGWPSWLSALYVSVLWGVWHVPFMYPEMSLPRAFIYVLPLQVAVGLPLSLWWRRSGNLTVTGTTHAFIDAVRNATSGLP